MTPYIRLYACLGRSLALAERGNRYREWVENVSGAGFVEPATSLEALLDELAAETASVADDSSCAMCCELDFLASAWNL